MSMGLPTIASNWSGNTEFMNDNNSLLVSVEMGAAIQVIVICFVLFGGGGCCCCFCGYC
jgi:hypothetical protein